MADQGVAPAGQGSATNRQDILKLLCQLRRQLPAHKRASGDIAWCGGCC